MVFSSLLFLFLYLPTVLLGFYALPRRLRNPFLLIVNLIFYGWGEPIYIVIMLFTTVVNYIFGIVIEKTRTSRPKAAKLCVFGAVLVSLASLAYFKYITFLTDIWNSIPFLPYLSAPNVTLPIGISFYTFQTMSYSIDVYRRDADAQRSLVDFGTYVTLFPQLIAGPIVRYKDIAEQLDGNRAALGQFSLGIRRFVIGLSKKVLIANQMGLLWDTLRALPSGGAVAAWFGLIAYSLQIYFDFSGYSDMAVGLGKMLGFDFMENFNYPYISESVTEFWRRWHISLSTWFRDYVYIPLGGNRRGALRTVLNLFAVWFLTGLWHGASWNFVAWGLYYFLLLVIEKRFLLKRLKNAPSVLRHAYTLLAVMFGWALFYFDTGLTDCLEYISGMFRLSDGLISRDACNVIVRYLPLTVVSCAAATPLGKRIFARLRENGALEIVLCLAGLALCVASLTAQSYNPFLYFKF